jgi:hypothetical protein
MPGVENSGA